MENHQTWDLAIPQKIEFGISWGFLMNFYGIEWDWAVVFDGGVTIKKSGLIQFNHDWNGDTYLHIANIQRPQWGHQNEKTQCLTLVLFGGV